MTITYSDGKTREAVLLSRTEETLRVAIAGSDDVTELYSIHGTWVSDDCEPVQVQFAWQKRGRTPAITEADCCCPQELAARLVRLLVTGSIDEEVLAA